MVLTEAARERFEGLAVAMPELELAAKLRTGLPYNEVKKLAARTGVPVKRLVELTGIPTRRLARKRGAKLSAAQGEKIVRLERVLAIAFSVFEDEEVAKKWLETGNAYLDNQTPLDLLENEPGGIAVEHLLGQIEEGAY